MIDRGELKKGICLELDGNVYQVVDWQHLKLGRGSAQIKMKLKSLTSGATLERVFQASDKFTLAPITHQEMQYLYSDGEMYYFMDKETFEQISLPPTTLKEATLYLNEGMSVKVALYKGEALAVELPPSVELEVLSTEPGFKGDTQSATTKPAKLATGLSLQVPLFINPGDVIKVSTKSGEYLERVSGKS